MQITNAENKILFEVALLQFVHELDLIEKLVFLKLYQGASIREAAKAIGFSHVACLKHVKKIRAKIVHFFDLPKGIF